MKEFMRVTNGQYGAVTGKIGKKKDTDNTLAWRKDTWELVKADSIGIPYFHGKVREMPVVRLRNKKTGQEAYFANFHNPASTKRVGDQERFRDEAMKRQIALVNKLTRETGLPVFVVGDMNEREEYYNGMTKGAPMVSADRPKGGPAPKKPGIDWIFGSKGVTFTDYVRDRGALVQKTTDHPMIVSKARIG
jgi:hypothetical protein